MAIVREQIVYVADDLGIVWHMASSVTAARKHPTASLAQDAPECLIGDLGWMLAQASHTVNTELTAALESFGISPRAQCVLATAATASHTQVELARLVGLDKTTMVVTLDELEAAGLAERQASETDRRVRVIAVTDAGRRLLREAESVSERIREDVLGGLSEREREAFMDSLSRLVCGRVREPVACSAPPRRRT